MPSTESASSAEVVYDRQIRLFGADAQRRISAARVVVLGRLRGSLGAEVVKNLALAGFNLDLHEVASTKPCDDDDDAKLNMFLQWSSSLSNREVSSSSSIAKALVSSVSDMNPLITVRETGDPLEDAAVLTGVTAVVTVSTSLRYSERLDETCRIRRIPLMVCASAGHLGYLIMCLGERHEFRVEVRVDLEEGRTPPTETRVASYPPMAHVLKQPWSSLPTGRGRVPDLFLAMCLRRYIEDTRDQEDSADSSDPGPSKRTRRDSKGALEAALEVLAADGIPADYNFERIRAAAMVLERDGESAAVCTVLGGLVVNEVLTLVSGVGEPVNNVLLLDATVPTAVVRRLGRVV